MSRKISLKGAQVEPEISYISTCDLFHGELLVAVPEGTRHPITYHISSQASVYTLMCSLTWLALSEALPEAQYLSQLLKLISHERQP